MEGKTYYEILGVSTKCTPAEIKTAYRALIKKFHPDKIFEGNALSIENDVKLINKAYEILKKPHKRSEYDNSLKVIKKKTDDFMDMKRGALEFMKAHEISPEELKVAKIKAAKEYEQHSLSMDHKMGVDRRTEGVLTMDEMEKKISCLETLRDQEYIENIPTKICDEKDFNITRFNEAFDAIAKETNSLVQYAGDTRPYNEINACRLDEEENTQVSEFLTDFTGRKLDLITKVGNTKFVQSTKSLEELMKEREEETEKLYNMKRCNPTSNRSIPKQDYEYDDTKCINANGEVDAAIDWIKK